MFFSDYPRGLRNCFFGLWLFAVSDAFAITAALPVSFVFTRLRRPIALLGFPPRPLPSRLPAAATTGHFSAAITGGKTAAVLRTFVASCERVKIDPWAWFRDVLARIASHPVNQLDDLLPHRWAPVNQ